jgi:hypothetical protein
MEPIKNRAENGIALARFFTWVAAYSSDVISADDASPALTCVVT